MSKKNFNKNNNGFETSLVFGQTHNGIECVTMPNADRACDRVWFSAKQLENWSEMSTTTLWRWLERIEKARRISRFSDMKNVNVSTSTGAVKTTFYNLNVLNQLAMACIDNEKLNEVSSKFSDILSEVETKGYYKSKTNTITHPSGYAEALRALADEVEARERAEAQRDEAIRTKAHFVEGRDAELNGRVGGLTKENNKLRDEIGNGKRWKRVATLREFLKEYFYINEPGFWSDCGKTLTELSYNLGYPIRNISSTNHGSVNAYHTHIIDAFKDLVKKGDAPNPVYKYYIRKYPVFPFFDI